MFSEQIAHFKPSMKGTELVPYQVVPYLKQQGANIFGKARQDGAQIHCGAVALSFLEEIPEHSTRGLLINAGGVWQPTGYNSVPHVV